VVLIVRSLGASVPSTMLVYLGLALALIARLRRPMARYTSLEQSHEGDYRFGHSRIITNAEEISFYSGGSRELQWLTQTFSALTNHTRSFIAFKFITEFFENFVAKYFATVVGYFAVGRPFFLNSSEGRRIMTQEELEFRQENYYKSGRMLVNMSQAIGKFVLNAKDLSRLAGYTGRICDLMRSLNKLNEEEANQNLTNSDNLRKTSNTLSKSGCSNSNSNKNSSVNSNEQPVKNVLVSGRFLIQDNVIRFTNVPIVTPTGETLLSSLNMEVRSGMNVLVSGPNGSGKSSLFRILGELWPLHSPGELTKPLSSKLFYIPQKPYMPHGSFRDQVIYPDSSETMKSKGITDEDLLECLRIVDLHWMVLQKDKQDDLFEEIWAEEEGRTLGARRSWDSIENWMDVLSGGQKQRLAMARLFYHKPQFAILDECTRLQCNNNNFNRFKYWKKICYYFYLRRKFA
jgi:ATP-binding cassette subfamily D (ALD) protein 3